MIDIEQALRALVASNGSDLHLKVGSVPTARVHGELVPLSAGAGRPLEPADTERVVRALIGENGRMAEFEYYGMQSFDQALLAHVRAGRVSVQDAMTVATNRNDLKLMLDSAGRRGTTMADVPTA